MGRENICYVLAFNISINSYLNVFFYLNKINIPISKLTYSVTGNVSVHFDKD